MCDKFKSINYTHNGEQYCTLSMPKPNIYKITMNRSSNGQPENRIERDFLDFGLSKALDDVEFHWRSKRGDLYPAASLILTGSGLKFFSNGLVLDKALDDKMFFAGVLDPFILRLSSFPREFSLSCLCPSASSYPTSTCSAHDRCSQWTCLRYGIRTGTLLRLPRR